MGNQINKIKEDLESLVEEVKNPDIDLKDALDKYNLAIELSLKATSLIEQDSAISEILQPETEANSEKKVDLEGKTEQALKEKQLND